MNILNHIIGGEDKSCNYVSTHSLATMSSVVTVPQVTGVGGGMVMVLSAYLLMRSGGVGTREGERRHTHSANSTHGYWYLFLDGTELL